MLQKPPFVPDPNECLIGGDGQSGHGRELPPVLSEEQEGLFFHRHDEVVITLTQLLTERGEECLRLAKHRGIYQPPMAVLGEEGSGHPRAFCGSHLHPHFAEGSDRR
jgi:hypothetical protein